MDDEFSYAKLKTLNDLIRFVGLSPAPFLFHIKMSGKHLYFIQILSWGGGKIVYYTECQKALQEKYVVFNRFQGKISFSNQIITDGQSVHIPIFEVEKTNIFREYPPK